MKPPIDTISLFPRLNGLLINHLKSLTANEWRLQTVARLWKVKDVASHLLDGNYRRIALHRDQWSPVPDSAIKSHQDLVDYLNELNADWVKATRRLSPAILIDLLESTNDEVYKIFSELDPFAPATFPVGWAGESYSYNWFDIAREYTERWLHQQQIREAIGSEELLSKEFYYPLLNIFMQAWPFTMREVVAVDGTVLKTTISGEGGGSWTLINKEGRWKLGNDEKLAPIFAETIIPGKEAWKLFSKSIRPSDIEHLVEMKGDQILGAKVLHMVSVMA